MNGITKLETIFCINFKKLGKDYYECSFFILLAINY